VAKHAKPDAVVFEIGCNVGMNLKALWDAGFRNLVGLELNPHAVEKFKVFYPEMAQSTTRVMVGSVEDTIPSFCDRQFDVVFTVRTLAHIHKESDWVMAEIARIAKDLLITIEVEEPQDWKHFSRNYQEIFERFGFRQVERPEAPAIPKMGLQTVVRVLRRPS